MKEVIKRHPIYLDYGSTKDGIVYSFKKGKCYKMSMIKSGKYFAFFNSDIKQPHRVHRFMYECFNGIVPVGLFVCHNDGNSLNNLISNLRVDTPKGNSKDACEHGTIAIGERQGLSKLISPQVMTMRKLYASGVSSFDLAMQFNVEKSTIIKIVRGKYWKHIGGPILKGKLRCKLSIDDVCKIKELVTFGAYTNRKIAKQFGVSNSTITDIIKGRSWKGKDELSFV